jgi:hypothetical protein
VLGKTQNSSYKWHKAVKTDAENQYVFENALPVIVEPEVWENAQRLKKTVRRPPKSEDAPNPLTGLLYCTSAARNFLTVTAAMIILTSARLIEKA